MFSYAGFSAPWDILALMNAAVEKKELAFSDSLAKKWGVEWLDLSRGPSLPILAKHLKALKDAKYVPPYLTEWVKPADAEVRYAALEAWHKAKGHFYVSNGPFYLDKVDPPAKMATIKAFREYVFTADKWDHLVVPKVPDIEVAPIPEVVPGMAVSVEVKATVAGVPYSDVDVSVLVVDPKGITVIKKVAELVAPGKFKASLTEAETVGLIPGVYTVTVIAVGWEAALARVVTAPMTVIPLVGYFEERFEDLDKAVKGLEKHLEKELGLLGETLGKAIGVMGDEFGKALIKLGHELGGALKGVEERTMKEIGDVSKELEDTHSAVKALSKSVEALSGTVTIVTALVAVAVVLSLASVATSILAIRKR